MGLRIHGVRAGRQGARHSLPSLLGSNRIATRCNSEKSKCRTGCIAQLKVYAAIILGRFPAGLDPCCRREADSSGAMIFERQSISDDAVASGYDRLETGDFIAIWKGFLFLRSFVAGHDSVVALLDSFRRLGPEKALAQPRGSFLLCVLDKRSQEAFSCVDPFGLMRLFVAGPLLSDDLFGLIGRLGFGERHLDASSLAFFLRFGFYGLGRTIDRRVRFISGDEIARLSPGGELGWLHKSLPDFRSLQQEFDFDAYVRDINTAIQGQRASLDLTGGYDSRLLAACLKDSIAETATTGQPGNLDLRIARNVAMALKLPHAAARHDISGLDDRAWILLRLTHGQSGILTYDHVWQLTRERQARGITLVIAGIGGELWKDILWLQDLPFLSGAPHFERLFRTRLEPRTPSAAQLTSGVVDGFATAKQTYLDTMHARFGSLPRTAAYDCVYAFLRIPYTAGPSVTAGINMRLPTFCPLYDPDGAIASMHKSPGERLFSRWHRKNIARFAPEIAGLRTDDGFSARSGLSALADLPAYAGNKALRLAQKVAQRLGLPDVRNLSLDDPRTLETARTLSVTQLALDRLRRLDVLAPDADAAQIPRALLDRLVTSGMAIVELSGR